VKETRRKIFYDFASRLRLKSTKQREIILNSFLEAKRHMSAEEFYRKIKERCPKIGYATVCRTLKLFVKAGIAREIHFLDDKTRYEPTHEGIHHDHLICLNCGHIEEFEDESIEKLQQVIADNFQFEMQGHRLDIYGLCRKCQKKK